MLRRITSGARSCGARSNIVGASRVAALQFTPSFGWIVHSSACPSAPRRHCIPIFPCPEWDDPAARRQHMPLHIGVPPDAGGKSASGIANIASATTIEYMRRTSLAYHKEASSHVTAEGRTNSAGSAIAPAILRRYAGLVLPFKLIYSDRYDLNLGAHVFPSQKYRLVRDRLLAGGIAAPEDFLVPQPATDEDVLRVHSPEYVRKLLTGGLDYLEILRLEIPYSKQLIEACWLAAGGSILAGRRALEDGCAANIGGGFHHAYPDHGEGFCVVHDVAVAIRRLQFDRAIERAMVVDTDVHQGNGTAAIFGADPSVFTFSIHQENNYPYPKPPSALDVNLPDGIGDGEYLGALDQGLRQAFHSFRPELLFYIAGADPYREDQLGGLALSIEGLARRDALVFEYARANQVPIAIAQAGGYARRVEDTVRIHVGTILAARDATQRARCSTRLGAAL